MKKPLLTVAVIALILVALLWWNHKRNLRYKPPIATNESGVVSPSLHQAFNSLAGPVATSTIEPPDILHGAPYAGVNWIPQENGGKPLNALSAGEELVSYLQFSPRTIYVCRASHGNGLHPGKLVGGACNIAFGGQEIEKKQYEVAAYSGGSWGNRGLNGALVGGFENGQKLYVCRHHLTQTNWPCFFCGKTDFGWHSGKYLPNTKECHWGYGGTEMSDNNDNEFFYP